MQQIYNSVSPALTSIRQRCFDSTGQQGGTVCQVLCATIASHWMHSDVRLKFIFDHLQSKVAWYMILWVYVCLSVCNTITFESLDVSSSFLHIWYISREYGSSLYMNVIGSMSTRKNCPKIPIPAMQNKRLQYLRFCETEPRRLCAVWGFAAMLDW